MASSDYQTITLSKGKHDPAERRRLRDGARLHARRTMPFHDHLVSVCPVIDSLLRAYNYRTADILALVDEP
jgi:hypothetical protein